MSLGVDEATNDVLWKVYYDDGDSEDYNRQELEKILCSDMNCLL